MSSLHCPQPPAPTPTTVPPPGVSLGLFEPDCPWETVTRAREASEVFASKPEFVRKRSFEVHDRIVASLGADPRFHPATVSVPRLCEWVCASEPDEMERRLLGAILNALLLHAVDIGMRARPAPLSQITTDFASIVNP